FEQMAATIAQTARERKRITTARQIEQLKKALAPCERLIPAGVDVHELMQHVIDHLRSSPLKVSDLKPQKPTELGPYETIGLQLKLEGHFPEIDKFLAWIGTDGRLLRVDSIKLEPSSKDPSILSAEILLLSLGAKPQAAGKTKPQAAGK